MPMGVSPQPHRVKVDHPPRLYGMIARQLTKQEIAASPKAKAAIRAEYDKLRNQDELGTWLEDTVREKSDVMKEAQRAGKKVHFGRIFHLCHLKHEELPPTSKNTKDELYSRATT